jgi:hypothetical protein
MPPRPSSSRIDDARRTLPSSAAVTDQQHVRRMLGECCSHSTPALLLGAVIGQRWDARFKALLDQEVMLDLLSSISPESSEFAPGLSVSAGFTYFDRAHFFVAHTREVVPATESQGFPQLLLAIPAQLAPVECRNSFRVPILPGTKLQVQLTTQDGVVYKPRPIDISSSGICVEFDHGACPDLQSGARVEMEIRTETRAALLFGSMCHRQERQFGFSFPQVLNEGELKPSGSLFEVVWSIELDWLLLNHFKSSHASFGGRLMGFYVASAASG